ncbi:MAG: M24 family metallopeptidase [candidate division Zixibacteria bacterium]|nr:M24 family metallopeptidase [candidate division Zixibacteria bacterium]
MLRSLQERALTLQRKMAEKDVDFVVPTDPDTICYMSGFCGYMGMELGRPKVVAVPRSGECTLITPAMVHRRPTVRTIQRGDPVYMCFCGIANFKHFKLGFDREYFVGRVKDEHARIYEIAIRAQQAALDVIRPGVTAEEVHKAPNEVYQEAGFGSAYGTGRGIRYSILERPQLKDGDKTPLQSGMTLAVDGGVTVPGQFGARVGDSVVVTEGGYEFLTPYPKDLRIL